MDVIYLFFKGGSLSLPMYGYDNSLFYAVSGCPRVRFDSASRTFYTRNMETDLAEVKKVIGERVCIMVNEEECSIRVQNFFSREWKSDAISENPRSIEIGRAHV